MNSPSCTQYRILAFAAMLLLQCCGAGVTRVEAAGRTVLFTNVNVFDGKNEELRPSSNVLVEGNLIARVTNEPIAVEPGPGGPVRIDGGSRTLMPGLMDMHVHMSIFRRIDEQRDNLTELEVGALAAARTHNWLMSGYTTLRDTGGASAYLRRAIDVHGILVGPRIFSAEALVTQTSGHGDFRDRADRHPNMFGGASHYWERRLSYIADGPTEIRRAVRENLRRGATHIKIMATGGVSSEFDPIHSVQYTPVEIRAAVEAAAQWDTYVTAHGIANEGIRQAVENGVMCIEHGAGLDEETVKLMKRKGVWLVPNLWVLMGLTEEQLKPVVSATTLNKWFAVKDGMDQAMKLAVQYDLNMAYGTDMLPTVENALENDRFSLIELEYLTRYMPAWQALRMATGSAGELAMMSGPNNPYPDGKLGRVEPGYYADLLLVEGDPTRDIRLMLDPKKNFRVIMKDGVIYKNSL